MKKSPNNRINTDPAQRHFAPHGPGGLCGTFGA